MSKPPTPDQMISILKRWGIPYKEYKTWRTHNRGDRGNGWGDMHGLILHHTGSNNTDQREMLWDGFADLPGPLCHFGIAQDGVIHLIGWGRANHAGSGDPNVLKHVINEDYTGRLKPKYHEGSPGAADGNGHFYGAEIWYDGNKPMTAKQYRSATRLGAGITEFHKWSELSVIMHGEWTDWKWDPGVSKGSMINPVTVRTDIKTLRKAGPNPTKPPEVPVPTEPTKKTQTTIDVWSNDSFLPPAGEAKGGNEYWAPYSTLKYAAEQAHAALIQTRSNGEMLSKIMQHLGIS